LFRRPYLEKTHHKKRAGEVAQGLEMKSYYCKKRKENQKRGIFALLASKISNNLHFDFSNLLYFIYLSIYYVTNHTDVTC
jgi:hypothetical protein